MDTIDRIMSPTRGAGGGYIDVQTYNNARKA